MCQRPPSRESKTRHSPKSKAAWRPSPSRSRSGGSTKLGSWVPGISPSQSFVFGLKVPGTRAISASLLGGLGPDAVGYLLKRDNTDRTTTTEASLCGFAAAGFLLGSAPAFGGPSRRWGQAESGRAPRVTERLAAVLPG